MSTRTTYAVTFTVETSRDDQLATWRLADKLAMYRVNKLLRGSDLWITAVTVAPATAAEVRPAALEDAAAVAVPLFVDAKP